MEKVKPSGNDLPTQRKPYQKPRIETVALRPKETVLGLCRSASIAQNALSTSDCRSEAVCFQDTTP